MAEVHRAHGPHAGEEVVRELIDHADRVLAGQVGESQPHHAHLGVLVADRPLDVIALHARNLPEQPQGPRPHPWVVVREHGGERCLCVFAQLAQLHPRQVTGTVVRAAQGALGGIEVILRSSVLVSFRRDPVDSAPFDVVLAKAADHGIVPVVLVPVRLPAEGMCADSRRPPALASQLVEVAVVSTVQDVVQAHREIAVVVVVRLPDAAEGIDRGLVVVAEVVAKHFDGCRHGRHIRKRGILCLAGF